MVQTINVTVNARVFEGMRGTWLWSIAINGDQIMGKSGFPTEKAARDDMRNWARDLCVAIKHAAE